MALDGTITWEVRTAGNDLNGGGFKPGASGTDFSQQDSPAHSYTDLAIDATAAKVVSAGNPFETHDVGNILQIASGTGFTPGFYEVTAVDGSHYATLDRSPGTANSTGGVGRLGGALATPTKAIGSAMVGGNLVWIKAGTYNITASLSPPGSVGGYWSRVYGYNASRGDLEAASSFTNHPVIRTNNTGVPVFDITGLCTSIRNLSLTTTGATLGTVGIQCNGQSYFNVSNCRVAGMSGSGIVIYDSPYATVHRCFVTGLPSGASRAFYANSESTLLIDCVAHGNACYGFEIVSALTLVRCIASANTSGSGSDGQGFIVTSGGGSKFVNCLAHGNSANGWRFSTSARAAFLINCLSIFNTLYGVYSDEDTRDCIAMCNGYYGNGSGARYQFPAGTSDVTLTGDPCVNSATLDFSLNATAGAGGACRNAGFPGTLSGTATTGYNDVGPARHQDPAAGGGGIAKLTGPGLAG